MNLNNLTDEELINYTILHSTNPTEIRLATFLSRKLTPLLEDLTRAGMQVNDGEYEFRSEFDYYSPSRYIEHLQNELEYQIEERLKLQEELDRLSTRTLIQFLAGVDEKLNKLEAEARRARINEDNERSRRVEAEQKWEMWDVLTHGGNGSK
jgi:hypothetical protein